MNLYLMCHGQALPGERVNAQRELAPDGVEQAEEMACFLVRQIGRVDIVISSPFKYALQTAQICGRELGAHVVTTGLLKPDMKPKDAWAEIERLAQASADVLVVGHPPELCVLVDFIAGATGIGHSFEDGATALVDTTLKLLRWLVTPQLVAREISIDGEEAGVIADLLEMADAGLELAESLERRSLKHPDHARLIRPIEKKVRRIMVDYFEQQTKDLVHVVRPWLKLHMSEASTGADEADDAMVKAIDILPDHLAPFTLTVSTAQADEYRGLISDAVRKAEAMMEAELNSGSSIPETALTRFITSNSLQKLTGDIADTTKQRMRNAIAETIRRGGTSEDIITAIEDVGEEFTRNRAAMIAQTEVNGAYSFGRDGMARAAGLNEKNWIVESERPCLICIANEAQGWIPIDDNFLSGDAFPTAHPLCACGVDYRIRTQELPVAA